jgi:hypothetical protein
MLTCLQKVLFVSFIDGLRQGRTRYINLLSCDDHGQEIYFLPSPKESFDINMVGKNK